MSTVVIYKSETGFTEKYARWIAEDLNADIYQAKDCSLDMLKQYTTIIYGGGLYAVGIDGVKFITSNLEKLAHKKIVVFTSGASPARPDVIEHVIKGNFTQDQFDRVKFFYLRGGFNYNKLKPTNKILMILLKYKIKLKLKLKGKLTPDEKGMLFAYNDPVDFTNKKYINDLIEYAKS